MRRDSIFYKLFQTYPGLLFELLRNPPENATEYRFDSVAVKEPRFEIDGVFLPPENKDPGVVYFCEVQFQKDERLYERVFAESLLYFYRNRDRFSDWQGVIIYPNRNIEQSETTPYDDLLKSDRITRVYLEELGNIRDLPLEIAVMLLTTVDEQQAPQEARYLLQKTQQKTPKSLNQGIIELITTIIAYKFEQLSKKEVEEMLGITFEETRVYREIKQEGIEEGREEGEKSLILRQLTKRMGELSPEVRQSVENLSIEQLENLGEALLDFTNMADLNNWLKIH
ncbi:Rpn family recombination-promoting nuclease/putative transposase [Crocosphaera sp.]|uniref:Rpn family recombination-promoting nuclease/putative transposase n=1 Tax=Crocosphaera sp. TaxID=2729996 RepID=UPI003F26A9CA|nr:Rpn family recombination-promoting nuclease/putative transposase [Crocosphaera sp.]